MADDGENVVDVHKAVVIHVGNAAECAWLTPEGNYREQVVNVHDSVVWLVDLTGASRVPSNRKIRRHVWIAGKCDKAKRWFICSKSNVCVKQCFAVVVVFTSCEFNSRH